MSYELFRKFSINNTRFLEIYGNSYIEYISKNCNLSNKLIEDLLNIDTVDKALEMINKNDIEYTHNYLDSKIIYKPNIELVISKKNT